MKLETDLEVTIESGKEFQILTIRLVKKFLSRSETTVNLANLNELPRVEVQNERATIQEESISLYQAGHAVSCSTLIKSAFSTCLITCLSRGLRWSTSWFCYSLKTWSPDVTLTCKKLTNDAALVGNFL